MDQSISFSSFRLEFLQPSLLESCYQAVLAAKEHIHAITGDTWPDDTFSREEELCSLQLHEQEFQEGSSFAYAVFQKDRQIGCLYFYESGHPDYDLIGTLWTDSDEHDALLLSEARTYAESLPYSIAFLPFEISKEQYTSGMIAETVKGDSMDSIINDLYFRVTLKDGEEYSLASELSDEALVQVNRGLVFSFHSIDSLLKQVFQSLLPVHPDQAWFRDHYTEAVRQIYADTGDEFVGAHADYRQPIPADDGIYDARHVIHLFDDPYPMDAFIDDLTAVGDASEVESILAIASDHSADHVTLHWVLWKNGTASYGEYTSEDAEEEFLSEDLSDDILDGTLK